MVEQMSNDEAIGQVVNDHLIDLWMKSIKSFNTRRSYKYSFHEFIKFCEKNIKDITREDVRDWIGDIKERDLKPSTINSRLAAIWSFYDFAISEFQLVENNPADLRNMREKVEPYAKSRALTDREVERLIKSISYFQNDGLRDLVLIYGYAYLGRRNTEWRTARRNRFEMKDKK